MSEAEQTAGAIPQRLFDTRQPFDLTDEMQARVEELGLEKVVAQAKNDGFGYIYEPTSIEFNNRLRKTILHIAKSDSSMGGGGANMLLHKDPIFEEVVLNPKILTIAEIMCGRGAMLSQLAASVKPKGGPSLPLHADQNWTPAPFQVHNQLVTFCWATDEYTKEGGSTKIVPGSFKHRRHPTEQETKDEPGAIGMECPAGTIAFWDGSTWHGSWGRSLDGERVVLHITFSRLAMRPVESYDFLGEDWLENKPYEMRVMLGREDFLNTSEGGFAHGLKLPRTMNWAKS